jgi:hypothetical protein
MELAASPGQKPGDVVFGGGCGPNRSPILLIQRNARPRRLRLAYRASSRRGPTKSYCERAHAVSR